MFLVKLRSESTFLFSGALALVSGFFKSRGYGALSTSLISSSKFLLLATFLAASIYITAFNELKKEQLS